MDKLWLIYSADKNWAIGNKGDLLVRIPEDMKDRFKALTIGKTVVMGKKTLLSLPGQKGLPKRFNIVLSRKTTFTCENAVILHSMDDLFTYLDKVEGDVFVIGGGDMYNQLRPYADGAFVTKIYEEFDADTFVDNLDELDSWSIVSKTEKMLSITGVYYSYVDYINNDKKKYGESDGK